MNADEVVYGTVRRCVRDGHTDCEASRDDCVVELVATTVPKADWHQEDGPTEWGTLPTVNIVEADWMPPNEILLYAPADPDDPQPPPVQDRAVLLRVEDGGSGTSP